MKRRPLARGSRVPAPAEQVGVLVSPRAPGFSAQKFCASQAPSKTPPPGSGSRCAGQLPLVEAAGRRITDAEVTAVVHGLRHTPEDRIGLEPMTVGGAQAYGGFATLPARNFYRIEVEVLRPGGALVRAVFPHRHFQP